MFQGLLGGSESQFELKKRVTVDAMNALEKRTQVRVSSAPRTQVAEAAGGSLCCAGLNLMSGSST
jgi:hypothetical protein